MRYVKKIIISICVISFMFTTEIQAQYEPEYNNEEKIIRVSDVDGKWWNISSYGHGSTILYYMDNIAEYVGEEPYWRLGKNCYYAIYKIEEKGTHYLIMNFPNLGHLGGAWYVSKIPSKKLFEKYVDIGTPLEVVKLIDPDTFNTYGMMSDPMCATLHRFDDGTYVDIHYKKIHGGIGL